MTIEDAAELRLRQPHVVRLESRPASVEGRGEVTIRDLLRNALRMRPDRIVIGEVRGAEALDLLTALNTGHDGALSTVHANSPEDALRRVETLALMAGVGFRTRRSASSSRAGVDLVVHMARGPAAAAAGDRGRRGRCAPPAGSGCASCWRARSERRRRRSRDRARRRSRAGSRRSPLREAALAAPGGRRAGSARRSSRCGAPAARATCRPRSSGGAWRCSGRRDPRRGAGRARARARRRSLAAAGPGGGRLGGRPPARAATAGRSSAALAEVATAVADALSVGRSARAALAAAAGSLEGPPAREMERVRAELALGASTREALEGLRGRAATRRESTRSPRRCSPSSSPAATSPTLLRRFAAAAADRDRTEADARSATAQARFTGLLVVAMPVGAALLAELLDAGLRRRAARRPGLGDACWSLAAGAAARRLRRDPAPEPGGRG